MSPDHIVRNLPEGSQHLRGGCDTRTSSNSAAIRCWPPGCSVRSHGTSGSELSYDDFVDNPTPDGLFDLTAAVAS